MKTILFGLSVLAGAATASAYPICVSLAPTGLCDAMQFNSKNSASWNACGVSLDPQTTAKYKKKRGSTTCVGAEGCATAAFYGYDSLDWSINVKDSTATVSGVLGGEEFIFAFNARVSITEGTCAPTEGSRSVLAR